MKNKHRKQNRRKKALRFGKWAEALATGYLLCKGHQIICRNLRNPCGEIDIIALRRKVLVFIEVKARRTFNSAIESLGPRQRGRIGRAANLYLGQHPQWADFDMRFDLIIVQPWRLPRHIIDAWRPGVNT